MSSHPAMPIAPPWMRGSLAKATVWTPPTLPVPASVPLSSVGRRSSSVPGSNSASSRDCGSRPGAVVGPGAPAGGCAVAGAATGAAPFPSRGVVRLAGGLCSIVMLISSGGTGLFCSGGRLGGGFGTLGTGGNGSGSGEGQRDVGAAEAERVVEHGHRLVSARLELLRRWRDGQPGVVVGVLEVHGWRGHPVAQRQDRRDRLDRAGPAEQVTGHRLGGGHHHARRGVAER